MHTRTTMTILLLLTFATGCSETPDNSASAQADASTHSAIPPQGAPRFTSSADQQHDLRAELAMDGDRQTRWSSPAGDPQWWQVDLGRPRMLHGLVIHWETAFGQAYRIEVSDDGQQWRNIYETNRGDGGTDIIMLPACQTRFVRIFGTRRGTGWGYSIWEVELLTDEAGPQILADGQPAKQLMDGSLTSVWTAPQQRSTVVIDLQKPWRLGGVRVDWGENSGREVAAFVSADGEHWNQIGHIDAGSGGFDVFLQKAADVQFIRLAIAKTQSGKGADIRDIALLGEDEQYRPLAIYRAFARKARPGLYSDHLRSRQVYWTVTGVPRDSEESLLDEYGNCEPASGQPTLMPYIYIKGNLHSPLDSPQVSQRLLGGYLPLPSVHWQAAGLDVDVEAMTAGETGRSVTLLRYTLRNDSDAPIDARLLLAVRPVQINPIWQHGGLAAITELTADTSGFNVNGKPYLRALHPADAAGACRFDYGDVARYLDTGDVPELATAHDNEGLLSGAMAWDVSLPAGRAHSIVVAAPLHDALEFIDTVRPRGHGDATAGFEAIQADLEMQWRQRLEEVGLYINDGERLVDTLRSQLAYILINQDGDAIQPGSRNYNRSWIRDGGVTTIAMMRMGLFEPARKYLSWYADRVTEEGMVPPIINNDGTIYHGWGANIEYDSQGQFIHAMLEYVRLTGDEAFLKAHYPAVVRAMKFMQTLRERTLAEDYRSDDPARHRYRGILPASISHEGYHTPHHSYWDDYWALKGWADGADAARRMDDADTAAWAEQQRQALQDSLAESIRLTMQEHNLDTIPSSAELGDFDPTSTAIAFMCDATTPLPPAALEKTFDIYFRSLAGRDDPNWSGAFTPYEVRSVQALAGLGQPDRARKLLNLMLDCRRPPAWNHLAEVVHGDYRKGSYIGDMPHTWVGSGYVNSLRRLLVDETDRQLILLPAAAADWIAGEGLRIANLPTHFGPLTLTARWTDDAIHVDLSGNDAQPPEGLIMTVPDSLRVTAVDIDGQPAELPDGNAIPLPTGVSQLRVQVQPREAP